MFRRSSKQFSALGRCTKVHCARHVNRDTRGGGAPRRTLKKDFSECGLIFCRFLFLSKFLDLVVVLTEGRSNRWQQLL